MTPREIARSRLLHQGISGTGGATAAEVVARLGALQGQDYFGVKWAIALRMGSATDADIEESFAKGDIVRTWPMRGTLHVVAGRDVRWILSLLAPRVVAKNQGRYRQLGLDWPTLERATDVIARCLRGGRQLTRDEIEGELANSGIDPSGQRLAYMLQRAGLDQAICFGVRRGNDFTYALLDERVPPSDRTRTREEALVELTRRYFSSRGPATAADFAVWSGLTLSDARAGLSALVDELAAFSAEGQTYWTPRDSAQADPGEVHALPGFDEYLLGYQDRSAVLDSVHASKVVPGGNGVFFPMIVVDGQVVGTWKRTVKKDAVEIEASPFTSIRKTDLKRFEKAAARYAAYLGLRAVVRA